MKALCSTGRKSQKPVFIIHLIWPVHSVVFQGKHLPLSLSRPNKCSPAPIREADARTNTMGLSSATAHR